MKYRVHDTLLSYICCVWNSFAIRSLWKVHFEVSVLVIAWGAQDNRFRQVPNEWVVGGPHAPYSNSSLVIRKLSPTPDTFTTLLLHLHLHSSANLKSSSWRCWWFRTGSGSRRNAYIFRKNELGTPVLVFISLVPSAGEGLGLGREGATGGTAKIPTSEGRRNSEPSNQEVGSFHRTQEGRKKQLGKQ